MAKLRSRIPEPRSAEVLFLSDHMCCVCRVPGKSVQIHHINGNPADHRLENLAALCFDDHNRTQIRGGFGRHLKAAEVILYRDSWLKLVASLHDRHEQGAHADTGGREQQSRLPPSLLAPFVLSLPTQRLALYQSAHLEWDTGITTAMNHASYELIAALEEIWVYLARWYPSEHFDLRTREQYIRMFVGDRSVFHRAIYQPEGEGSAGTIIGQLTTGGVISDLERLIEQTVEALWFANDLDVIDLPKWRAEWGKPNGGVEDDG